MNNTVHLHIRSESDILLARKEGRDLAAGVGFGDMEGTLVAAVVSEVTRNIIEYARQGVLVLSECRRGLRHGIQIVAMDEGPGIADVGQLMATPFPAHSTMRAGMGLAISRRSVDEFDLHSSEGRGTVVILRKWLSPESVYSVASRLIDWGVDTRIIPGGSRSVGTYVVSEFGQGALIGVVGGMGGDGEAAVAESAVAVTMSAHAADPVKTLLERCHEAALKTTGAVFGLASFDRTRGTVSWAGVGRVRGFFLRSNSGPQPILEHMPREETLGPQASFWTPNVLSVSRGDSLAFTMDGDGRHFPEALLRHFHEPPQTIAERVMEQDDQIGPRGALALVARYKGG